MQSSAQFEYNPTKTYKPIGSSGRGGYLLQIEPQSWGVSNQSERQIFLEVFNT